jgi:hypothetical protein
MSQCMWVHYNFTQNTQGFFVQLDSFYAFSLLLRSVGFSGRKNNQDTKFIIQLYQAPFSEQILHIKISLSLCKRYSQRTTMSAPQ